TPPPSERRSARSYQRFARARKHTVDDERADREVLDPRPIGGEAAGASRPTARRPIAIVPTATAPSAKAPRIAPPSAAAATTCGRRARIPAGLTSVTALPPIRRG